jgi:pimeloyl-ACP methyl ester carboxylesterase
MSRLRINGVEIYYIDLGDDDEGVPLVLLHGWPCDHALWMLQTPVFSQYYRVIAPDFRGLGSSTKPAAGPITVQQLSDDVRGLADALGLERFYLMGLSLGGVVAEQFCLDNPKRVRAAVWVGAPSYTDNFLVRFTGREEPILEVYRRYLESGGYAHFWNDVWKPNVDGFFHRSFYETPLGRYLINYLFEERYAKTNSDPSGAISILKGLPGWNVLARLREIKIPVMIVVGDGDPTLRYCQEQHRNLPGSEYHLIRNSGHISPMDQAEEFNRITLEFLRRHYSSLD